MKAHPAGLFKNMLVPGALRLPRHGLPFSDQKGTWHAFRVNRAIPFCPGINPAKLFKIKLPETFGQVEKNLLLWISKYF
jgi:hypothetical protein